MPIMIQEIFDYYFEQKTSAYKDIYASQDQLKSAL